MQRLLPPLLTTLATRASNNNTPARLLILATKVDLLIRPTPTVSCPSIPAATRQTAIDRIQSILTREMDRLKQTRASTGGRIEGISSVASSSKSWTRFFGFGSSGPADGGDGEVEEDEGLVWGGKGGFRWQDIEGVEVSWGAAALGPAGKAVKADVKTEDGINEVREWLLDL
jgi:signal recognition particle receptor subunit beta